MPVGSKYERVVEAVRRGLEGDDAVAFIQESGFAITSRGIARILHAMGGRKEVEKRIGEGLSNLDIVRIALPDYDIHAIPPPLPEQQLLFTPESDDSEEPDEELMDSPLYDARKISLKVPADLFEAIRLAAKAEKKSQNALIVEILKAALSELPRRS